MVAATLELENERNPPPLEEKSNVAVSRKPRNREVSSRYKSAGSTGAAAAAAPPPPPPPPPSIRRFPSPNFFVTAATAPPLEVKRAISAERKRSGDAVAGKIDHALKPAANRQRSTPERKRIHRGGGDQAENARPIENVGGGKLESSQRWPGRSISRSLDLSVGRASSVGTKGNKYLVPAKSFNQEKKVSSVGHDERKMENGFPGDGASLQMDVRSVLDDADLASSCDFSDKSSSRSSFETVIEGSDMEKGPFGRSGLENGSVVEKSLDRLDSSREKTSSVRSLDKSSSNSDLRSLEKSSASLERSSIEVEKGCLRAIEKVPSNLERNSSSYIQRSSQENEKSSLRPSKGARGTIVPARFWQDLGTRIRRLSDVNQLRASMPEGEFLGSKTASRKTTKGGGGNSAPSSTANTPAASQGPSPSWVYSPLRTVPAPTPTVLQPPQPPPPLSPSSVTKISSPSRALPSPTRTRIMGGAALYQGARPGSVACMLNFGNESLAGRKVMNQQDEALYLRILHNRWLQWRYVNARSQAAMSSQKATGERLLYNASLQISDLQSRVAEKRIRLQKAKQESKIHSMIMSHGEHLEEWSQMEPDHAIALSGVIAALEAATLKVPVTGGAKIDIPALQNALTAVGDAMAPLGSTTRELLPRAEKTNEIVCQLAQVSSQGKALLQECGELLDRIARLEIEERSLRSYVVQLDNEKNRSRK